MCPPDHRGAGQSAERGVDRQSSNPALCLYHSVCTRLCQMVSSASRVVPFHIAHTATSSGHYITPMFSMSHAKKNFFLRVTLSGPGVRLHAAKFLSSQAHCLSKFLKIIINNIMHDIEITAGHFLDTRTWCMCMLYH